MHGWLLFMHPTIFQQMLLNGMLRAFNANRITTFMRTSVCHVVIKPHKSDSLPAITKRTFHDVVSLTQSTETAAASTNTKALKEVADQKWQIFFYFSSTRKSSSTLRCVRCELMRVPRPLGVNVNVNTMP